MRDLIYDVKHCVYNSRLCDMGQILSVNNVSASSCIGSPINSSPKPSHTMKNYVKIKFYFHTSELKLLFYHIHLFHQYRSFKHS